MYICSMVKNICTRATTITKADAVAGFAHCGYKVN
jgi:hypothetical protein